MIQPRRALHDLNRHQLTDELRHRWLSEPDASWQPLLDVLCDSSAPHLARRNAATILVELQLIKTTPEDGKKLAWRRSLFEALMQMSTDDNAEVRSVAVDGLIGFWRISQLPGVPPLHDVTFPTIRAAVEEALARGLSKAAAERVRGWLQERK